MELAVARANTTRPRSAVFTPMQRDSSHATFSHPSITHHGCDGTAPEDSRASSSADGALPLQSNHRLSPRTSAGSPTWPAAPASESSVRCAQVCGGARAHSAAASSTEPQHLGVADGVRQGVARAGPQALTVGAAVPT